MASPIPPASPTPPAPQRWRLDVAYDGTAFSGWATQPGLRTVQGELERWITRVLRLPEPASLTCAGRTDAGVHARGQVAHLDLPADFRPSDRAGATDDLAPVLLRRLGRVLDPDLVVTRVSAAPAGFDARFSAVWRRYCYRLWDGEHPVDPLHRNQVATTRPLDLPAMNEAAGSLVGLRDFAAFCKRREGATTVRTLLDLHGTRLTEGPLAGVCEFTVRADAFCHSMVRSVIGALVAVGSGRRGAGWVADIAARGVRDPGVTVMPAHGLTLEEVSYPPDDQLAARAVEARNVREVPT